MVAMKWPCGETLFPISPPTTEESAYDVMSTGMGRGGKMDRAATLGLTMYDEPRLDSHFVMDRKGSGKECDRKYASQEGLQSLHQKHDLGRT